MGGLADPTTEAAWLPSCWCYWRNGLPAVVSIAMWPSFPTPFSSPFDSNTILRGDFKSLRCHATKQSLLPHVVLGQKGQGPCSTLNPLFLYTPPSHTKGTWSPSHWQCSLARAPLWDRLWRHPLTQPLQQAKIQSLESTLRVVEVLAAGMSKGILRLSFKTKLRVSFEYAMAFRSASSRGSFGLAAMSSASDMRLRAIARELRHCQSLHAALE